MQISRIILVLIVSLSTVVVSGLPALQRPLSDSIAQPPSHTIILAQQSQDQSVRTQPPASIEPPTADVPEQKPSSKTKKETKPIKEFVPSEQIEADKAVDFPADI